MSKATEVDTPTSTGGIRYEHPAMVTVGFSRQQHGFDGTMLFGSDIRHHTTIALRISRATVDRHLATDWVHGEISPIIEVWLSPMQFAELLTTMNVGTGIPATLVSHGDEQYERPEMPTKAETFKREVGDELRGTLSRLMEAQKQITSMLEYDKPLGKKAKMELSSLVRSLERLVNESLPFIMTQFSKQMSKTVADAKSEVDAFVQHAIITTGLEVLRGKVPQIEAIEPEEKES